MAAVHVVVDGGAALPAGAAAGYGLTQVAHHVQVGATRFHAGTADPADLAAALADPRLAILPASREELAEAYAAGRASGVSLLSLHSPAVLHGLAAAGPEAAAGTGLDGDRLALAELPLLGPALGLVALHAAEAAQDIAELGPLAGAAVDLAKRLRGQWVVPDSDLTLARARGLDLAVRPADQHVNRHPGQGGSAWLRFSLLRLDETGEVGLQVVAYHDELGGAMRALADAVLGDGRGRGPLHLAGAATGADAEVAALATYLDAQLGLAEAWLAQADPISAYLGGPGSFGLAWYVE